ncbi:hypothetical protein [Variovorax durovernensis]
MQIDVTAVLSTVREPELVLQVPKTRAGRCTSDASPVTVRNLPTLHRLLRLDFLDAVERRLPTSVSPIGPSGVCGAASTRSPRKKRRKERRRRKRRRKRRKKEEEEERRKRRRRKREKERKRSLRIHAMNMVLTTFSETHRPVTYMRHLVWLAGHWQVREVRARRQQMKSSILNRPHSDFRQVAGQG